MNPSIDKTLREHRDAGKKLLVPYVTGGLGKNWAQVLPALVEAGADAIEIGVPFSDPSMDGPTIQEASTKALASGATPLSIFDDIMSVDVGSVPLIVMTYYNIAFHMGEHRFASSLAGAGISGAILPDLPLEESAEWERQAADEGIETILMAAPVTPDDRLARIADRSRGFVYAVGLMGVTGERSGVAISASIMGKRLKAITDKPVLIGFGVSTPVQAVEACVDADGVVIGSALVRRLLDETDVEVPAKFIGEIRQALDNA